MAQAMSAPGRRQGATATSCGSSTDYLASAAARRSGGSAGAAGGSRRTSTRGRRHAQSQIRIGKTSTRVRRRSTSRRRTTTSTTAAIQLLRTAFELYKRDDLLSDLFAHFREPAEARRRPTPSIYPQLALSYLRWWNDDKDEALGELTAGRRAGPGRRRPAARAGRAPGAAGRAATRPWRWSTRSSRSTSATMQRRELLALRLAVLDRQRRAGPPGGRAALRPAARHRDPGRSSPRQMHQLGMHELAEAVLARARRRAATTPRPWSA